MRMLTYIYMTMSEPFIAPYGQQPANPSSTQHISTHENDSTESSAAEFTWSVPFSIDTSAGSFLNHAHGPVPEDSSIPRDIIAEEVRSTRFLAELLRPLRLGLHNDLPAYLLCFSFSFQRLSSGARIRQATITIRFDDAPADTCVDEEGRAERVLPPAILDFYPKDYAGPVSTATLERSSELSMSVSSGSLGVVTPSAVVATKKTWEEEGSLVVHGLRQGRPVMHQIVWTVKENKVLKDGIPRTLKFPLIVRAQKQRRFSAAVVVNAHYGIRRGLLASRVPVLGRYDEPIYFDPANLERMAKEKERSVFDGNVVVIESGDITQCDLSAYSLW
jgi:hypothetical protein